MTEKKTINDKYQEYLSTEGPLVYYVTGDAFVSEGFMKYHKEVEAYVLKATWPLLNPTVWEQEDLLQEIYYASRKYEGKVARDSHFAHNLSLYVVSHLQNGHAKGKSKRGGCTTTRDALCANRAAKGTEAALQEPASLSTPVADGDGGELLLEEVTPDTSSMDGFESVELRDTVDWIVNRAKIVSQLEWNCFELRILKQYSLEETAQLVYGEYKEGSPKDQYRLRDKASHHANACKRKLASNPKVLEALGYEK